MERLTVIPALVWVRDDGERASRYGPSRWVSFEEKARWTLVMDGWTWRDNRTDTVVTARQPVRTEEEAQRIADYFNTK